MLQGMTHNLGDARSRRALPKPTLQGIKRGGITESQHLDTAVGSILRIPGNA